LKDLLGHYGFCCCCPRGIFAGATVATAATVTAFLKDGEELREGAKVGNAYSLPTEAEHGVINNATQHGKLFVPSRPF